jgi:hypothetical protein
MSTDSINWYRHLNSSLLVPWLSFMTVSNASFSAKEIWTRPPPLGQPTPRNHPKPKGSRPRPSQELQLMPSRQSLRSKCCIWSAPQPPRSPFSFSIGDSLPTPFQRASSGPCMLPLPLSRSLLENKASAATEDRPRCLVWRWFPVSSIPSAIRGAPN